MGKKKRGGIVGEKTYTFTTPPHLLPNLNGSCFRRLSDARR
jgi:hypothetical protein